MEVNRERGKGIQGFNMKLATISDDWCQVPLRPSEDPYETHLRNVHQEDKSRKV